MPMLTTVPSTQAPTITVLVGADTSYDLTLQGAVKCFRSSGQCVRVGSFVRARSGIPTVPEDALGSVVHIRVHPDHCERVCAAFVGLPFHQQKEFRMHEVLQTLFARDEATLIVHFASEGIEVALTPEHITVLPKGSTISITIP